MGSTPPRRYWLTGAGNGIGASLAETILRTGAHLAVSSRLGHTCEALSTRYPRQVLIVAGDLTDSQSVREAGERIAQEWGSLDTLIINAGTAEYIGGQPVDRSNIEHIVRSNLLAASFCIEAAVPLLRAGNMAHLVGITSLLTYLPPSQTEAGGNGMRHLFESARAELADDDIEVTVVHPGPDTHSSSTVAEQLPPSMQWTAETAANLVMTRLDGRPHEVILPAMAMNVLWPLPSSNEAMMAAAVSNPSSYNCPIKGQP